MEYVLKFVDDRAEVLVKALPIDFVMAERKFGIGMGDLEGNPHLEHILYLTWSAYRRQVGPEVAGTFDAFLLVIADFDPVTAAPLAQQSD